MVSFDSLVDTQVGYLVEHTPFKSCPKKIKVIKLHTNCVVNVPPDWDACLPVVDQIIGKISDCAKASGEKYDYVIGYSGTNKCGTRGWSSESSPIIYLATHADWGTTHEMGHQWGLADEYYDSCRCYPALPYKDNCLDASIGGSDAVFPYTSAYCASGSLCTANYEVTCSGNKNSLNTRCLMGGENSNGLEHEFCKLCKDHLNCLLKC
jgi:hypothetical protein